MMMEEWSFHINNNNNNNNNDSDSDNDNDNNHFMKVSNLLADEQTHY